MNLLLRLLVSLLLVQASAVWALSAEEAHAIAEGDSDARVSALHRAMRHADSFTLKYLEALAQDGVRWVHGKPVVVSGQQGLDPVNGMSVELPDAAEEVVINNRLRAEIEAALATAQLLSPQAEVRRQAIEALKGNVDASQLEVLDQAYAKESIAELKEQLGLLRATVMLDSEDAALRITAARALGESAQSATKAMLLERLQQESDAEVRAALRASLQQVESVLAWGEKLGAVFSGVSLGSILLLVALGLAITYGLMGVINMAHGELMMVGAYATYLVQLGFRHWMPGAFDYYLLAAVPAAFAASALVGAALERTVIRHLYGRPLETLLATWGISLVLMQLVRSLFGAQNVAVENPSWMSGGIACLGNLTLAYNRLVIIAFALAVLGGVAFLIGKTRLGLFVRGVTQNRAIAACMGVHTARVDTYAFALGSGIAGLAGCALSQIGNVGPDLGQGYIVDAFMVVVLGGVGQLAGTVYAALGLGVLNKFLEAWAGAVLAKIAVLVFIIVFIQKRPQGIFAMRGRSVEA